VIRRVLLVGFMGSGKSTVGPLLADALSWRFVDFDDRLVEEEGRSVARIFEEDGEPYFREVEERLARSLLDERDVVLASGGGWAAVPGRLRALAPETLSVWLRVSPDIAVARVESTGGRPLLTGPDPATTARRLIETRTPAYAEATVEVDTDGRRPIDVSRTILALVERRRPDAPVGT
jgi:shikimate kinase